MRTKRVLLIVYIACIIYVYGTFLLYDVIPKAKSWCTGVKVIKFYPVKPNFIPSITYNHI